MQRICSEINNKQQHFKGSKPLSSSLRGGFYPGQNPLWTGTIPEPWEHGERRVLWCFCGRGRSLISGGGSQELSARTHSPSGSSTVLARRRERVSRLSWTLSCSIARSIIGSRSAGLKCRSVAAAVRLVPPWPALWFTDSYFPPAPPWTHPNYFLLWCRGGFWVM